MLATEVVEGQAGRAPATWQNSRATAGGEFRPQVMKTKLAGSSRTSKPVASTAAPKPTPSAVPKPIPSPNELRRLALDADVCEATVVRYLKGEPVRPGSRERIERAIARRRSTGGSP